MEKETGKFSSEIQEWTVSHFKFRMRYIAWKNFTEEKYNKLMKDKK